MPYVWEKLWETKIRGEKYLEEKNLMFLKKYGKIQIFQNRSFLSCNEVFFPAKSKLEIKKMDSKWTKWSKWTPGGVFLCHFSFQSDPKNRRPLGSHSQG